MKAAEQAFRFCPQCGETRVEFTVTNAQARDFPWLRVVEEVESCPKYCDRILISKRRDSCRYTLAALWEHAPVTYRCAVARPADPTSGGARVRSRG